MNSRLQFWPTNWKNGMAFSQNHLREEYLANLDRARDAGALGLTDYNYGLLGGETKQYASRSFQDQISGEQIAVSLCRAVTQNGSRIEILDQDLAGMKVSLQELLGERELHKSDYWYVVLVVDEFTRVPFGEEDERERPRRKPHSRATYSLELMPMHELEVDYLANAIPLAKIRASSGGAQKVEDYIPPCCRIDSYDQLVRVYEDFGDHFSQLHTAAGQVMQKIIEKRRANRDQNHLADDIYNLCRVLRAFHNSHMDQYRLLFKQQPPIALLSLFSTFARTIEDAIAFGYDANHLYSYFRQYASHLNESELKAVLSRTWETAYQHYDAQLAFAQVRVFLQTYAEILERLVQLDYRELAPRGVVQKTGFEHTRQTSSWLKQRSSDQRLGGNLTD